MSNWVNSWPKRKPIMNGVSSHSFSNALIVVSPLYVVLRGTSFYLPNSSANLVVGYFWLPWTNVLLVEQTELIDDPTHQGSERRKFLIDDPTPRAQRGGHLTPGLGSPLRRSPTRQVRTSPRTTDMLLKLNIFLLCLHRRHVWHRWQLSVALRIKEIQASLGTRSVKDIFYSSNSVWGPFMQDYVLSEAFKKRWIWNRG